MGPYRVAPHSAPSSSADQLGFRSARIRVGADRFELSFREEGIRLVLAGLVLLVVAGAGLAFRPLLTAGVVAGAFLCMAAPRRHLVVTRHGSWGITTVLGVRIARHALGRHPKIDDLGWDWQELAVYPLQPAQRAALHDGERFVLVEWGDGEARRCRDGQHLVEIARAEIARLHGRATASS